MVLTVDRRGHAPWFGVVSHCSQESTVEEIGLDACIMPASMPLLRLAPLPVPSKPRIVPARSHVSHNVVRVTRFGAGYFGGYGSPASSTSAP